jgi:carbon-monoxide dehydrogenase small subunit
VPEPIQVALTVNGRRYSRSVEPRLLLSDFLRHELGLTGTHVGCEHGVCGACTVLVDGQPARACLMLAVQADGAEVMTVEGLAGLAGLAGSHAAPGDRVGALAPGPDALHPIQEAFWEAHGLQCGFCTPGFLMTTLALLRDTPRPSEEQVRAALSGNLCRCTGYQNIVNAVLLAAERLATPTPTAGAAGGGGETPPQAQASPNA